MGSSTCTHVKHDVDHESGQKPWERKNENKCDQPQWVDEFAGCRDEPEDDIFNHGMETEWCQRNENDGHANNEEARKYIKQGLNGCSGGFEKGVDRARVLLDGFEEEVDWAFVHLDGFGRETSFEVDCGFVFAGGGDIDIGHDHSV